MLCLVFLLFALVCGCTNPRGSAPGSAEEMAALGCVAPAGSLVESAFRASWSPDGKRIVYSSKRWGGLDVIDVRSHGSVHLVKPGKDPAWSPDGGYIAYVIEGDGGIASEEVWIVSSTGGEPLRVGDGGFPCWSPDGRQIIYHSRKLGKMLSVRIDALDEPPVVYYDRPLSYYPAVSPDGGYIAFGALRQLVIVERETGETVASLPAPFERGFLPGWSPDGSRVAFGGFHASRAGMWIYDLRNRGAFQIATHGNCTLPAWSPDGKWLAFDVRDDPNQIWMLRTRDLPRHPFLLTCLPDPSPDRDVAPHRAPQPRQDDLVGKPAPGPFAVGSLWRERFSLMPGKGTNAFLLNFWSCSQVESCTIMLPFSRVARDYARRGIRCLAVNSSDQSGNIIRYLHSSGLDIDIVLDEHGKMAEAYRITRLPTIVIVDRNGLMRKIRVVAPFQFEEQLRNDLDEVLGSTASTKTKAEARTTIR